MNLQIEIDLKNEKQLVATARYLMELAGHQMVPAPVELQKSRININTTSVNKDGIIESHSIGETILPFKPSKDDGKPIHTKFAEAIIDAAVDVDTKIGMEVIEEKKIRKAKKSVEPLTSTSEKEKERTLVVPAPPYAHCAPPVIFTKLEEPIQTPTTEAVTFGTTISKITKLINEKKLTHGQVLEIIGKYGLTKTTQLSTADDLLPSINVELEKFV